MKKITKDITDTPPHFFSNDEKVMLYETNGIVGDYFASNRKINEMNNVQNNYAIDLNADDKAFERWMKWMTEKKDILETQLWLESKLRELYPNESELKEGVKLNTMEAFLNKNKLRNGTDK